VKLNACLSPFKKNWLRTASLTLLGAALSFVISGHVSGFRNNAIHMDILAGLPSEPQFANDPFIQSIRFWASGFWFPLAGEVDNETVYPLLLTFNVISRLLFFGGALACATILGVESFQQRLIFVLLTALSTTMRGVSHAGGGGLFIESFTQSEVVNATTLFMLAGAARGQVAIALTLNGLTFFINAFVGVWNAVPLAIIFGAQLRNGAIEWRTVARQGALGMALAAILVFPVLRNILSNPDFGRPIDFNYIEALTQIWPEHFLVWTLSRAQIAWLVVVTIAALLASRQMRPHSNFLVAALLGFVAIWLFGVVVPWLSQSPTLINLELLRSSSSIQLCATLAFAGLATRLLTNGKDQQKILFGCVLAVLMNIPSVGAPLILPFLVAEPFLLAPPHMLALPFRSLTVITIVLLLAFTAHRTERRVHAIRTVRDEWASLGKWARANTAPSDVFLLPVVSVTNLVPVLSLTNANKSSPGNLLPRASEEEAALLDGNEVFQYFSHRMIWISHKEGSNVMWMQSLYHTWVQRMTETLQLNSLDQRLAYASSHGVAYVVDTCKTKSEVPIWKSTRLCVYRVHPVIR
jgi:hypothetical protein